MRDQPEFFSSLPSGERMVTLSWLRFEWDLEKIPAADPTIPAPFMLSRARPADAGAAEKVAVNSFGMDTGWSDIQKTFATTILRNVRAGFAKDPPDCMVVRHGSRIIGVSVLDTRGDAPNHLRTGPCVLQEYRGRGLGSALLRASLAGLREAGFARAYGVARAKTAASRFLYTKFGGQGGRLPQDFEVARKTAA